MDSLNTILNSGTYGENVSRHNDNNSKIKQAITTLENVAIANKGYFDTLASLQAAFPSPKAGNIAYVANVASSTGYYIYKVVSGVWTATTTEAPAVDVEISNYAQHGYSSSPKTLKQVDDEVVQLAGDVDINANFVINAYSTSNNIRFTDNRVYIKKEGFSIVNPFSGNRYNIIGDSEYVIDFTDMLPYIARRYVYIDTTELRSPTSTFDEVFIFRDESPYNDKRYILFLYGYRNIVHPTTFSLPAYAYFLKKLQNNYIVDFGNTNTTKSIELVQGNIYDTITTPQAGVIITLEGQQQCVLRNLNINPLDVSGNVIYRRYVYINISLLKSGISEDNNAALVQTNAPINEAGYILFAYFFNGRLQPLGEFAMKLFDDITKNFINKPKFNSDFVVAFAKENDVLRFDNNKVRIKRTSLPYTLNKGAIGFINKSPSESSYIEFSSMLSSGHNRTFLEIDLDVLQNNKISTATDMDTPGLFVLRGNAPSTMKKYEVLAMWYNDRLMPIGAFGSYILDFQASNSNNDVLYKQLSKIPYFQRDTESSNKLFTMLHMSDIHNDTVRMQYAIDVLNQYPIDCGILSGDILGYRYTDPFSCKGILLNSSKPMYSAIGNHDVYTENDDVSITGGSNTDVYNKFIQPFEAIWGINTGGKSYYHIDNADKKLRLIFLNQYEADMLSSDGKSFKGHRIAYYLSQVQINWFSETLRTTPPDYGVIVVSHDKPAPVMEQVGESAWNDYSISDTYFSDNTDTLYANIIPAIVDAFINKQAINQVFTISASWLGYANEIVVNVDFSDRATSEFITYLHGHYHGDYVSSVAEYPQQKTVCISVGKCENNTSSGDTYRDINDYSQHLFNIVSIDRGKRLIKLIRIGANLSTLGKDRTICVIDY